MALLKVMKTKVNKKTQSTDFFINTLRFYEKDN
jgi:hypothetical protein